MKKVFLIFGITICYLVCFSQETDTFTDPRDGKVYKTVKIGTQTWMAENLNYYTSNSFYFDLDSIKYASYGRLYYFNDALKACPVGWHLPNETELTTMIDYLGGPELALYKLSEDGSSGFNALLGGGYDKYQFSYTSSNGNNTVSEPMFGQHDKLGTVGLWWTIDKKGKKPKEFEIRPSYNFVRIRRNSEALGLSVRYLKD